MRTDQEVYKQAIGFFGVRHQVDLAVEEMSELTKALMKYRRAEEKGAEDKTDERLSIIEEMADVEVMFDQLKMIYDCESVVALKKYLKTERLAKRLKEIEDEA